MPKKKKKYRVKIDISKAIADLKALGLSEPKKLFWITVEAEDPDDCCAVSYAKVHDIVFNQKISSKFKEAAEIIKKKMKILKITAQS